jgi:hypothetical protein
LEPVDRARNVKPHDTAGDILAAMKSTRVRWPAALAGAIIAEVAQVAAAFAWVAIYSYAINPGQPVATYEQYAQLSGPWVSVLAGGPIFYLASRRVAKNTPTALALFGIFFVLDLGLLLASSQNGTAVPWAMASLSYSTKLVACYLGGAHAQRAGGGAIA